MSFDGASQTVREEDLTKKLPCGPDLDAHVEAIRAFEEAGYTRIALVQVGGDAQEHFIDWAASDLLPALRD